MKTTRRQLLLSAAATPLAMLAASCLSDESPTDDRNVAQQTHVITDVIVWKDISPIVIKDLIYSHAFTFEKPQHQHIPFEVSQLHRSPRIASMELMGSILHDPTQGFHGGWSHVYITVRQYPPLVVRRVEYVEELGLHVVRRNVRLYTPKSVEDLPALCQVA